MEIENTHIVDNGFFEEASSFHSSAKHLYEKSHTKGLSSVVVLASLALELYIKSIGVKKTIVFTEAGIDSHMVKHTIGHELDKLFDELHPEFRSRLSKFYRDKFQRDMGGDLNEHANCFVKWRYPYPINGNISEGITKTAAPTILLKLCETFEEVLAPFLGAVMPPKDLNIPDLDDEAFLKAIVRANKDGSADG